MAYRMVTLAPTPLSPVGELIGEFGIMGGRGAGSRLKVRIRVRVRDRGRVRGRVDFRVRVKYVLKDDLGIEHGLMVCVTSRRYNQDSG